MNVRLKKNKSGSTSVVIIEKVKGKNKIVKTIGSSTDQVAIEKMARKARREIQVLTYQNEFNFDQKREEELVELFYSGVKSIRLIGPELLLGKIFDEIGFNKIKKEIFRHLVITRLINPTSKLKTIDYLYRYKGIYYHIDQIYRYLDKHHEEYVQQIQEIAYQHGEKVIKSRATVLFYDVTTLYFEAEEEDDLRKTGFSKDGKHSNPQILLGLLVNGMGFPVGYEIFEGNKFEGKTMLPVVEAFKQKYKLEKIVVVADAGLMNNNNIEELKSKGYSFILGARIKSETAEVKKQILELNLEDGKSCIIRKKGKLRLVVSFSFQRQKKDEYNRKRGLERLRKQIKSGKLTKRQLTKRGYNKYLKLEGETKITIDEDKLNCDSKWDGLKGYLTNTNLSSGKIISQYRELWQIEKAFRISKTDLRIRPIYHHLKRRIESHISIAFAACVIYKELDRQLAIKKVKMSVEKAIDIAKTIYSLTIETPYSENEHSRLVITSEDQQLLLSSFDLRFGRPNA